MHDYAHTIPRLLNQLRREEYSTADLVAIRDAYQLAISLFSSRFDPSGRVFITHVVGTASILVSLRAPLALVVAGLLHNVYQNGDFGDGHNRLTPAKRDLIRSSAGEEAEAIIFGFAARRWTASSVLDLRDGAAELSPFDRQVVLLRLADQLEHMLDLDPLYTPHERYYAFAGKTGNVMPELAEKLGYPALAAALQRVAKQIEQAQVAETQIAPELRGASAATAVILLPSCCVRWPAALRGEYFRRRRQLAVWRYNRRDKRAKAIAGSP